MCSGKYIHTNVLLPYLGIYTNVDCLDTGNYDIDPGNKQAMLFYLKKNFAVNCFAQP